MSAFTSLESLRKVHIVGVCGTLMGAFAAYLKRKGVQVTGSDQNVYPPMSDVLRNAGVVLYSGFRSENLESDGVRPDLVVIGNVIRSDNPEARKAIDGGYSYTSLPEALEKFVLGGTRNLVVAGTHGKTTTSSMLAYLLNSAGKEPSYFIGGVTHDLPYSFTISDSSKTGTPFFVLEGDEYDTAFWDKVPKFNHYLPDDVIWTSMEFDHADIYADFAAVKKAFQGLLDRIRPGGRLIVCTEYAEMVPMAEKCSRERGIPLFTYAAEGSEGAQRAHFVAAKIREENGRTRFEVLQQSGEHSRKVADLELQVPGKHNVLNALAVWILAREHGLAESEIADAFRTFRGVKRRQEVAGEVRGVLVIDDFAHHPTAVRETLQAFRARYPGRRLVAVFEPRSATSRRKVFQKDFASALGIADSCFVAQPYDQSRIDPANQFSTDQLVDDIRRLGGGAWVMKDVDSGVLEVARASKSGDVVAILSNGGFGGFIPKLLKALGEHRE